ncbi:hypothetical protein [Mycolicibacterium sp. XJ1819]
MQASAKTFMTAGVALVGAGVIAASPIAPPASNSTDEAPVREVSLLAATEQSTTAQDITDTLDLLQGGDPIALLQAFIDGTLEAFARPAPVPYTPVPGLLEGLSHIGQGLAATGLRFGDATIRSPFGLLALGTAIASGDTATALAVAENFVDGPLWVVDPALYNLRDALPAPLGGPDGLVENFRDQLWMITQLINGALAGPQTPMLAATTMADPTNLLDGFIEGVLTAFARPGPVPFTPVDGPLDGASRIAQGVVATGLRLLAASVLTPVGVVELATAVAQGDTEKALAAVENIVDGPLWVADPSLYGLRDALPGPLGGENALVEELRDGIWAVTQQINTAIRSFVEPVADQVSDVNPFVATEEFDAPQVDSMPNSQPRLMNLSLNDDEGPTTPSEDEPLTHNVVRQSPNFSPSGNVPADKAPTGDGTGGEVTSTAPTTVDDPGPVSGGDDEGTTPGGSEQTGSGSQGDDK